MRRSRYEYRHTAALSRGVPGQPDFWDGEVTLAYGVVWGSTPSHDDPGSDDELNGWRIVAIDREPVSPSGAPDDMILFVGAHIEALTPDLLTAARDREAYDADEAADRRWEDRRERMREARP